MLEMYGKRGRSRGRRDQKTGMRKHREIDEEVCKSGDRQRNVWEKMKKDGEKNTWERMEI